MFDDAISAISADFNEIMIFYIYITKRSKSQLGQSQSNKYRGRVPPSRI